jgi:hypothetical protein
MLLADSAQAVGGKLYILGGGWSIIGPGPAPSAIALKVEVPWDEANRKHHAKLELVNADNKPVLVPTITGVLPLEIKFDFEVGRPAGLMQGTPIDFASAINLGPLPLQPDHRYVWKLSIDEQHHEDWELAFTTRPVQPGQPPTQGI